MSYKPLVFKGPLPISGDLWETIDPYNVYVEKPRFGQEAYMQKPMAPNTKIVVLDTDDTWQIATVLVCQKDSIKGWIYYKWFLNHEISRFIQHG